MAALGFKLIYVVGQLNLKLIAMTEMKAETPPSHTPINKYHHYSQICNYKVQQKFLGRAPVKIHSCGTLFNVFVRLIYKAQGT